MAMQGGGVSVDGCGFHIVAESGIASGHWGGCVGVK